LKICCIGNGGTAGEFVCVSQIIYQVIIHLHRLTEKIGQPLIRGTPYEVKVWYDGDGEMYFKGGRSQFAEDHDLHQGFFMIFDYHVGTSKFDVKIYDGTQCQKEYEAEVHF
jgi:hypothetical protein